jgi:Ni,Fe-hydrogenase I cytochrome b subunit
MKRRRLTKKQRIARATFWLIHSTHWLGAFVFIFATLATIYLFFAGDAAFASVFFPGQ